MTSIRGSNNVLIGKGSVLPNADANHQIALGAAEVTSYIGGAPNTGAVISMAGIAIMPGGSLTSGSTTFNSQSVVATRISAADIDSPLATVPLLCATALSANGSVQISSTLNATTINTVTVGLSPTSTVTANLGSLATKSISAPSVNATNVNTSVPPNNIFATTINSSAVVANQISGSLSYTNVVMSAYKVPVGRGDIAYNLINVIVGSGTYYLRGADVPGIVVIPAPIPGAQVTIVIDPNPTNFCRVFYSASSIPPPGGIFSGLTVFVPKPQYWNPPNSGNPGFYKPVPTDVFTFNAVSLETSIIYSSYANGCVTLWKNVSSLIGAGGCWYEA